MNEIKINNSTLFSSPDIAEAFNVHFTNIGPNLASEIPFCDIPPDLPTQPLHLPTLPFLYEIGNWIG